MPGALPLREPAFDLLERAPERAVVLLAMADQPSRNSPIIHHQPHWSQVGIDWATNAPDLLIVPDLTALTTRIDGP